VCRSRHLLSGRSRSSAIGHRSPQRYRITDNVGFGCTESFVFAIVDDRLETACSYDLKPSQATQGAWHH
jgi:hypothetical protein